MFHSFSRTERPFRSAARAACRCAFRPTLMLEIADYVRKVVDTGTGRWVERDDSRPTPHRGRPPRWKRLFALLGLRPSHPEWTWRRRREDMCRGIVRHALGLCGLSGGDIDRILRPVQKSQARHWDVLRRRARRRLGGYPRCGACLCPNTRASSAASRRVPRSSVRPAYEKISNSPGIRLGEFSGR